MNNVLFITESLQFCFIYRGLGYKYNNYYVSMRLAQDAAHEKLSAEVHLLRSAVDCIRAKT